ncbi:endothelin-converting enzyme homolog [Cloeon dipterum]|uniref:endothelin-converting enzyme homolog n=1 Tax=Cloeon dipterum TaxID=197152 RepID=UPI0032204A57
MKDQFDKLNFEDDVTMSGNKTFKENIADHGGLREALFAYDLLKHRQTNNSLPDPEPHLPGLTNYSHKQLFFLGFANRSFESRLGKMQNVFSVESKNGKKMRQSGISRLIILLVVLVLMFAVISAILIIELNKQVPGKIEEKVQTNVCTSDECIYSASSIISSMDSSVDPCDDFYMFACGGYIETHPNSGKESSNDGGGNKLEEIVHYRIKKIFNEGISPSMPETVKQTIDYYDKCIDEDTHNKIGLELVFRKLESMGLPRIHPMQKLEFNHKIDIITPWPKVLIRGDKITGKTPFFSIEIELKNGKRYLACKNQEQVFDRWIFETFFKTLNSHFKKDVIKVNVAHHELIDFQDKLSKFQFNDQGQTWMSVAELQKLTDENVTLFDWNEFLTSYLEDSIFMFNLEKDKILVKNNVKHLFDLLKNTSALVLDFHNWFFYFFSMAPYSTTRFRDRYDKVDLFPDISGPNPKDTKERCIGKARDLFPDAITYAYLSKYFDVERKQKTEAMVNDIHQAFIQLIKGLDWMDEPTKTIALEKLDAVQANVGYPNWLFVPGALDERNIFIKDVKGDWLTMNLEKDIVLTKKFAIKKYFSHWTGLSSTVVDVQYGEDVVICRIIETNGNKNWWSKETEKKFTERVHCMINQLIKLIYPDLKPSVKLNGTLPVSENYADHGGLREALIVYDLLKYRQTHNGTHVLPDPEPYLPGLTGYSHKQLFFLRYANMWCKNEAPSERFNPARHRVLGTLINSKHFAEAWKCPAGSKMNPVDKCILW